jgi:CPA1 family monovalent cation:H+ antiporter
MATDITQLGLLLFVSALVAMLTRRLRLPYTVGLVLAGIGLHLAQVRIDLQLSRDLIFSLFLPPLIFEAALCLRWTELRRDLPVVTLLATVGVMLAAAVTTAGMHYGFSWSWGSAGVFGILIAATDPVSVIATFKEAGVHGRVRLLIESESLLNDATAAVAFVSALALLAGATASPGAIAATLLLAVGGGIAAGLLAGWALVLLAGRSNDHLVEFTLTTLAAYGAFFLAEHFHCSGVLAALAAGLVVGNRRPRSASSGTPASAATRDHSLEIFWEYVAFLANSLIFLLIGAQLAQQHFAELWAPILAAIALVTLGRALAIYPLCALFAGSRLQVPRSQQHVLVWGGLRGALALALALALPADMPDRETLITLTYSVVVFSVFVQGLTITPLLRRLGEIRATHD